MASDLALVEDQGQGIGQKPDHRQHHQGRGLVDSRVFEVAVGGEGLKNFGVDSPAAAAELMDEQRRDRAEFEIGGVEVGALLPHRRLVLGSLTVFLADRDATLLFDTKRFDDSHQAIGNGPIDLRQVPVSNLPARFGVNARGDPCVKCPASRNNSGWFSFKVKPQTRPRRSTSLTKAACIYRASPT